MNFQAIEWFTRLNNRFTNLPFPEISFVYILSHTIPFCNDFENTNQQLRNIISELDFFSITRINNLWNVTISWHQKMKPQIHKFTNLKCSKKAREPFKTLLNSLLFTQSKSEITGDQNVGTKVVCGIIFFLKRKLWRKNEKNRGCPLEVTC